MSPGFQIVELARLRVSSTVSQVERREHLDKGELGELAESIKGVGILQPLVVRALVDGPSAKGYSFEIVAGERRFLAAKLAKFSVVPVNVIECTDDQVPEIQLVENLQREDLHELAEAEGYEDLMKLGRSAEAIADKVGKSKAYVYARLKLTALCKVARKAFYAGDLTASTALLVARIPGDEQQERAVKHLSEKDWAGRPISYREAQRYVHETFMLKLSDAPFPREDLTLVPSAGACSVCPMRTGNAPADLFGDVKNADTCTNPTCFQSKKTAHIKRELEKARAGGDTMIRGSSARRILPEARGYMYSSDGSHKQLRNGYARPRDTCLEDPKKRTYAELAGKAAPVVMLQHPDTGRVERIFEISAIAEQLKAKGIKPRPVAKDKAESREQDAEQREQAQKLELAQRRAIFAAAIAAAPTKLTREGLARLLTGVLRIDNAGNEPEVWALIGLLAPSKKLWGSQCEEYVAGELAKQSEAQLARLAAVAHVFDDAAESWGDAEELTRVAKALGVDVKKTRAAAIAAHKPPAAPAPKKANAKGKVKR